MATKVGIIKFGQPTDTEPFKRVKKNQALLQIRRGELEWIVVNRLAREMAVKAVKDSDPNRFLVPSLYIAHVSADKLPVRADNAGLLLQYPVKDESSNFAENRRRIWNYPVPKGKLWKRLSSLGSDVLSVWEKREIREVINAIRS